MIMCGHTVSDTMDSILAASDEEDEQDAVISQVLDEIGIEVTGKVSVFMAASSCYYSLNLVINSSSC